MSDMFAQVIIPLSLHDTYTYKVPGQWMNQIKPGQRVVVQFGSKKLYAALVYSLSEEAVLNFKPKEILELLDNEPVVLPQNFELWKWMAAYYCCTLGDVFRAALPPGLKLESKSKFFLDDGWNYHQVSDSEREIINLVGDNISSLDGLQKKLGKDFSYSSLKSLFDKNLIRVE